MKYRISAALAIASLAALTPQSTFAQPTGWYIGLGGGYGTMEYTLATPSSSLEGDTDWARCAIATLGYKHASGFPAELEPNYGQYRVNDALGAGVGTITT